MIINHHPWWCRILSINSISIWLELDFLLQCFHTFPVTSFASICAFCFLPNKTLVTSGLIHRAFGLCTRKNEHVNYVSFPQSSRNTYLLARPPHRYRLKHTSQAGSGVQQKRSRPCFWTITFRSTLFLSLDLEGADFWWTKRTCFEQLNVLWRSSWTVQCQWKVVKQFFAFWCSPFVEKGRWHPNCHDTARGIYAKTYLPGLCWSWWAFMSNGWQVFPTKWRANKQQRWGLVRTYRLPNFKHICLFSIHWLLLGEDEPILTDMFFLQMGVSTIN